MKVQRPGIEATMRSDLDLLYLGAQVLETSIDEMQLFGVVSMIEEFEKGLLRELNFTRNSTNLPSSSATSTRRARSRCRVRTRSSRRAPC